MISMLGVGVAVSMFPRGFGQAEEVLGYVLRLKLDA